MEVKEIRHRVKNLILEEAVNGQMTGRVQLFSGSEFYLHSKYNPKDEATSWLSYVELHPKTAYIVLGFGLGYHVKKLLESIPENCRIYVIENSQDDNLTQFTFHNMPETHWMFDERLKVIGGPDIWALAGQICKDLREHLLKKITICRHFPTMQLFEDFYELVEGQLVPYIADMFTISTSFADQAKLLTVENFWANLPAISKSPGINGFWKSFENMPAIIVSAGPSLNKNIHLLKQYQDKALIIAVGTAIGAMNKHGIVPHFQVIGDKWELAYEAHKNCFNPRTALIAYYDINPCIVKNYPGKKFFCLYENVQVPSSLHTILPASAPLKISMSVAITALDFAFFTGANPIIFVGQDCAYAEHATHADGVNVVRDMEHAKKGLVTVKGYYGSEVKTELGFKALLNTLSTLIQANKGRKVVNATEGGAYINGALHMSLKDVGREYLKYSYNVWGKITDVAEQYIGPSQEAMQEFFDDLLNKVGDMLHIIELFTTEAAEYCHIDIDEGAVTVKIDVITAKTELFADRANALIQDIMVNPTFAFLQSYFQPVYEQFGYQKKYELSDHESIVAYAALIGQLNFILAKLSEFIRLAYLMVLNREKEM